MPRRRGVSGNRRRSRGHQEDRSDKTLSSRGEENAGTPIAREKDRHSRKKNRRAESPRTQGDKGCRERASGQTRKAERACRKESHGVEHGRRQGARRTERGRREERHSAERAQSPACDAEAQAGSARTASKRASRARASSGRCFAVSVWRCCSPRCDRKKLERVARAARCRRRGEAGIRSSADLGARHAGVTGIRRLVGADGQRRL